MRTRSKGPVSPNSYMTLDDKPARPRRTTRSTSAQLQESQEPRTDEGPSTSKTAKAKGRGKKQAAARRGQKKISRKSAKAASPEASSSPADTNEPVNSVIPSVEIDDKSGSPDLDDAVARECIPLRPTVGLSSAATFAVMGSFSPSLGSPADASTSPILVPRTPSLPELAVEEPSSIYYTPPEAPEGYEYRHSDEMMRLIDRLRRAGHPRVGPDSPYLFTSPPPKFLFKKEGGASPKKTEDVDRPTRVMKRQPRRRPPPRRLRASANSTLGRTIFRLPELLAQNEKLLRNGQGDIHHQHDNAPDSINQELTETAHVGAPVAPATDTASQVVADPAPVEGTPSSRVRWVFNEVSRRWTNIRDRISGNRPAEALRLPAAELVDSAPETLPFAAAEPVDRSTKADPSAAAAPVARRRRRAYSQPWSPPASFHDSLYPCGFDPELKARLYATIERHKAAQAEAAQAKAAQDKAAQDKAALADSPPQAQKRKREVSPTDDIPNPAGCSYGMDLDYFGFTDEEYDAEEKRRAAEEAKRTEAEHVAAGAPSAKKQRLGQWPRRWSTRPSTVRSAKDKLLSPSKRPGYVPSPCSYAVPELSPIDSSGLVAEDTAESELPPPAERKKSKKYKKPGTFEVPYSSDEEEASSPVPMDWVHDPKTPSEVARLHRALRSSHSSNPSPADIVSPTDIPMSDAPLSSSSPADISMEDAAEAANSAESTSIDRIRGKVEQFKPKTPSRLREALKSSINSNSNISSPPALTPADPTLDDTTPAAPVPSASAQEVPTPDTRTFASAPSPAAPTPSAPTPSAPAPALDVHTPDVTFLEAADTSPLPTGEGIDLDNLKWPEPISLIDQLRWNGMDLTDEDVAAADREWNDPVQRKRLIDEMMEVWNNGWENRPYKFA
ncbi:hypothetical protein N7532_004086 [Penicillium argentinense]|uniref:Uncharacterized protein n=1 Tax=Penicillium argentinense TaxID=1131581 RepID=A0A9W9FNP9_9EURO|nr:uncharacterized protein N7532_004086 [Penicillium argentinense]KAJ5103557.1 hypothetical protein N7532_004086 [Penicillium argentinense]